MTTIYHDIQAVATTTLIAKNRKISGNVSEITITNYDTSDLQRLVLYLDNPTGTNYMLLSTTMPPQSCLVLDSKTLTRYDGSVYNLKLTTATDASKTVIIK